MKVRIFEINQGALDRAVAQKSLELDKINFSGVQELDRAGVPPGMAVGFMALDAEGLAVRFQHVVDGLLGDGIFPFTTGYRVSEMINAWLDQVAIQGDTAEVQVVGKGSKVRKVIIPLSILLDIRAIFNGAVYLFFETASHKRLYRHYISHEISKAVKKVLGKTASAHDLRHSFATAMIGRTGKLKAVSEYLCHFSTAITMDVYLHEELTSSDLFG